MAALDVSAWDTQVRADVIQGYGESAIVPDGAFYQKVHTNQASLIFPKLTKRFAANSADGAAQLGVQSETEPGVALALDNPLKLYEYIPTSALNTQQGTIEGDFGERLGRDLRRGHDNRLIAFATAQGIARAANIGEISWQTGVGYVTSLEKAEAAGDVLKDILKNFAASQIPENERKYVVVDPDLYFDLLRSDMVRNRDFASGQDNRSTVDRIMFGGLTVLPAQSIWGTDQDASAGTELEGAPAKYLDDYSTYFGCGWSEPALGVGYVETLHTQVDNAPTWESVLVRARTQFGTAARQAEGFIAVVKVINT